MNTKTINHPLERLFDIEPNTTEIPSTVTPDAVVSTQVVITTTDYAPEYDTRDLEIDNEIKGLYHAIRSQIDGLTDIIAITEPKYRGEIGQARAGLIGHALRALELRSGTKRHKDTLRQKRVGGSTSAVTPGQISTGHPESRNELLRRLRNNNTDDGLTDAESSEL